MTSEDHFHTLIVGSGTSAYYCATPLVEAGWKVAIIDERPFGGTCALRGCQPKKYLTANAEAVAMACHLHGKGIANRPRTDWPALQALKDEFLIGRSEDEVRDWRDAGATPIQGHARFVADDAVEVGGRRLTADHIVLATGATPVRAAFPGGELARISDDFLNLPELPARIVFIGGGYISFEFAFVAAYAGAKVTVLQRSNQVLRQFEPEMVEIVLAAAHELGIDVRTNTETAAVSQTDGVLVLETTQGDSISTDLVIEAIGRAPNLSVLSGGFGNVAHTRHGVTVDEHLRSVSNLRVHAIGDCAAAGPALAPVGDEHGKTVAHNLLEASPRKPRLDLIPSAVFTLPPLASVGLTEKEATERGLDFRINRSLSITWASSKRIGERHAGYKVLIDNGSDLILGAHLARHAAAEVINLFALAIHHRIPATRLAHFPWAYPTMTSDLKTMVK
jgi:glutathione reductase (NADPH)